MTPRTLGKYSIVRALGAGGMGSVYLARDPSLDRDVAIKVILPELTHRSGFYERFHREARLVASLRHPNIVQVYDFAIERGDPATDADDQPFMVMEFMDGGSLKDRLGEVRQRGEVMPLGEITHVISAIAAALDHAHARGMVHRDIKPANILFRAAGAAREAAREAARGEPVLGDFGVARIAGDGGPEGSRGGVVGTPAYMSPEQASGAAVDARSDIYSLGVVLYEMACGRAPFQAESPSAVLAQQVSQAPPPPLQANPRLPAAVGEVIARALAKRPEARFASAGEMALALTAAVDAASGDAILDAPTMVEGGPAAGPAVASRADPADPATAQAGWMTSAAALAEAVSPLVGQGMPSTERLPQGGLRRAIAVIGFISVLLAAIDFLFRTLDRATQQFGRLTSVLPYLIVPALLVAFALAAFGALRARTKAQRRLAAAAAAAIGLASLAWGGWRVYQASLPPKGPVVVVAEFKGCTGCPDRIFDDDIYNELLKQATALNIPIEVRRVRESDHPVVGDTLAARQLGADNKAELVIWGTYDSQNVSPQFELIGAPADASPLLSTDDLRSFSYNLTANTKKLEHVAFLALGLMRYLQGEYENALSLFDRSVSSLPTEQGEVSAEAAYFYRANARLRTGKPVADIVSDLETAREYDPKSPTIRHNLSIAYINACTPEGIPALDQALGENTYVIDSGRSDAIPFEVRGWIYELLGDWAESADAYEEALRRGSVDPGVRGSLIKGLGKLGRAEVAGQIAPAGAPAAATAYSSTLAAAESDWYSERFDDAALRYQQAITEGQALSRPRDELARVQAYAGMAHMQAGRWQAAADALEASLQMAPRYFGLRSKSLDSPYVLLGMSYHQLKRYDQAARAFERALEIYPCDANTLVQLANTQLEQGRHDDALATLERAGSADPADGAVDFYRGLTLAAMGRPSTDVAAAYRAALAKYQALVAREPGDAEARDALERVRALVDAEAGPVLELVAGAAEALAEADFATARDLAQQAAVQSPENALAQRLLGRALRGLGSPQEAVRALGVARDLAPEEPLVHYELGMAYAQLDQPAEAIAAFQRAVALDPGDGVSWSQLANVLWRAGRLDEAQAAGRRAAELRPDDPLAHGMLGMVLVASQAYTDAVPALQQAVALSPTYVLASQFLASAHYRLGRVDDAAGVIRTARDAAPANPELQAAYAFMLAEQGKADAAYAEAQRAIELGAGADDALLQYALGVGHRAQGRAAEANAAFEAVANNAAADPELREKARAMIE